MSAPAPVVDAVLHPTDFSDESQLAFAHALAIALVRKATFTMLHAQTSGTDDDEWTHFPRVRETLVRWGLLEPGSPRSAVFRELQVKVSKIGVRSRSALSAIVDFVANEDVDLIVLATEGREGLPRWLHRSVAEPIVRRSRTKTLFVPKGTRGFVSPADGSISLQRVLVPVAFDPLPDYAVEYAGRTAVSFGGERPEVTLLHVGDAAEPPRIEHGAEMGITWRPVTRQGDPVEEILAEAEASGADLIAMATAGHEGILDALRGSTTEKVLRRAPCPVLAIPAA